MKPTSVFLIKGQFMHGKILCIEECNLMPGNGFLAEERAAIAAIHADHIQEYASSGLQMPACVSLRVAVDTEKAGAQSTVKTTGYTLKNDCTVQVQTFFHPTPDGNMFTYVKENERTLLFKDETYKPVSDR